VLKSPIPTAIENEARTC